MQDGRAGQAPTDPLQEMLLPHRLCKYEQVRAQETRRLAARGLPNRQLDAHHTVEAAPSS